MYVIHSDTCCATATSLMLEVFVEGLENLYGGYVKECLEVFF